MQKGGKAHISDDTVYQTDDLTEFPWWCKQDTVPKSSNAKERRKGPRDHAFTFNFREKDLKLISVQISCVPVGTWVPSTAVR